MENVSHVHQQRLQVLLQSPETLGHWLGYKELNATHGKWIKQVWALPHDSDFLLLAHRGSYKTTAIVVIGVIWFLIFNPEQTVLIVRKEYKRAAATLQQIRSHYQSQRMLAAYDGLGLSSNQPLIATEREDSLRLGTKQAITQEGNIEITGITARGVTGRHYDRIHLDDVVVDIDRDSHTEREKTKRIYQNLKSVIKPGGRITATGTPWHKDDLYSTFNIVERYPVGTVQVAGFTNAELAQKRSELSPAQYASQYNLKFIPESGQLFANIVQVDAWPRGAEVIAHIDPAFGGDDTTALTIAAYGGKELIVWGTSFTQHIVQHYAEIAARVKRSAARLVYVENNGDKGATARDLRKLGIRTLGYHETMNKHTKICTYLYRHWEVVRFYKETDAEYIAQIRDYVKGAAHDDAADSIASLLVKRPFKPQTLKKLHRQYSPPPVQRRSQHWSEHL